MRTRNGLRIGTRNGLRTFALLSLPLALLVALVLSVVPAQAAKSTLLDIWSTKDDQSLVQVAARGKRLYLTIQMEGLSGRYRLCITNSSFGKRCEKFRVRSQVGFGTSRLNYLKTSFPVRNGSYTAAWFKGKKRRLAPTGPGSKLNSYRTKHLKWGRVGGKWRCSKAVPSCRNR
jgi:hypothetical protein